MKIDQYFHLYGRKNDVVFEEVKWIPVSEALPEDNADVLVDFKSNMAVGYYEDDGWSIVTGGNLYCGIDDCEEKPVAWMPLPERYRGE